MSLNLESDLCCQLCDLRFENIAIMTIHVKIVHEYCQKNRMEKHSQVKLMLISLARCGQEKNKCQICNSGFALKDHLLRHESLVHN